MRRRSKKDKDTGTASGPSRLRAWLGSLGSRGGGRTRAAARLLLRVGLVAMLVVGVLAGLRALERRVLTTNCRGRPGRPQVYLAGVPLWMPDALAWQLAAEITPPEASLADHALARKVHALATANPWVRCVYSVNVEPSKGPCGAVEVRAEFRQPASAVRDGSRYIYVSDDAVTLPTHQVPRWVVIGYDRSGKVAYQSSYLARCDVPAEWQPAARQIHYVVIDGVAAPPPPAGRTWVSGDLFAGLGLVGLFRARPYFGQITVIDVRNHGGRVSKNEPELRMYAQLGRDKPTDIRFGRFPIAGGGDYVISPQRKASYLDEYVADHNGRLAGINSYLDLRYDQLHVSIN